MTTPYGRDNNGVLVRTDGCGDSWAAAHRTALPSDHYITDLDICFGETFFGINGGGSIFAEYEPDSVRNRGKLIRRFALIALCDRKANEASALDAQNTVATAFHLSMCRTIETCQPVAPKFFFVIGGDAPPWTLLELDIETGERTGEPVVIDGPDWRPVWDAIGLSDARRVLRRWLCTEAAA